MQYRVVIFAVLAYYCVGFNSLHGQTVTDADGNFYPTTTIGIQVWMSENLKTSKYNDGKPIPLVTEDKKWASLKTPAYCWLNNDIGNKDVYGALYNWYAVDTKKLCPKGWHVPSFEEWGTMIGLLGDESTAGDKLKEAGSEHWKNALVSGTNDFDFTALPGDSRLHFGNFPLTYNSMAVWWTSTGDNDFAWNRGLYFSSSQIYKGHENMKNGFSVRCIKDKE
jgi:uncharacterized protein (TIGR02145 family)